MGNIISQEPVYSQNQTDILLDSKADKTSLSNFQPKGDYAPTTHNHDADLKTKTMWCADGNICQVPANKYVKFSGDVEIGGKLLVGGKGIDDYIAAKTVSEDNVVTGLASNTNFIGNVQKSLYDNQKTAIASSINNKEFRDTLAGQLKTDSDFLNKARGPSGTISSNTGFNITGNNVINFGSDVAGKDTRAGNIGYGTFDNGASLNIVGAGKTASNRLVRIWDHLDVTGETVLKGGTHAAGWNTHFPFKDGRNYIRGPTNVDGELIVNGRNILAELDKCVKKDETLRIRTRRDNAYLGAGIGTSVGLSGNRGDWEKWYIQNE